MSPVFGTASLIKYSMNGGGMMSAEQLSLVGSRLVKRCGTRDPLQIAADIGIEVMMCDNFGPLKGMYRVIKRNRFIFINEDLPFWLQRIVCAHELGHDPVSYTHLDVYKRQELLLRCKSQAVQHSVSRGNLRIVIEMSIDVCCC